MKTYFTSSKYVKEFISINGLPTKISTKEFNSKSDALEWEKSVLCRVNAKHNKQMLNRSNGIGRWHNYKDGFSTEDSQRKASDTLIKKYGARGSASSEIKDKVESTNLERYGDIHTLNLPTVKEARDKANIEKYGCTNPFASKKFYEGRINPMHVDSHRAHHSSVMKNVDWASRDAKTKLANLDKYGVEHYYQSTEFKDKMKKQNIERYGVEHYSQSQEYKDKMESNKLACPYGCRNNHRFDIRNFTNHMKSKTHAWTNDQIVEYKGTLNAK